MDLAGRHAAERRELTKDFAERHAIMVRMQPKLRDPRAEAKAKAEHTAAIREMAQRHERERNAPETKGGKPAQKEAPRKPQAAAPAE